MNRKLLVYKEDKWSKDYFYFLSSVRRVFQKWAYLQASAAADDFAAQRIVEEQPTIRARSD